VPGANFKRIFRFCRENCEIVKIMKLKNVKWRRAASAFRYLDNFQAGMLPPQNRAADLLIRFRGV
jgi:hypothetical protein